MPGSIRASSLSSFFIFLGFSLLLDTLVLHLGVEEAGWLFLSRDPEVALSLLILVL